MLLGPVVCILMFRVKGPALGHCTRIKFSIYVHQTLMDTKCEQFYT